MFITCALRGLGRAMAKPRLAVVLWVVNAGLAALAALPAWFHLNSLLGSRPEADRLLEGFSFGLLAELRHYQGAWMSLLASILLPLAVVALLGNALTSGGVLEVLTSDDDRRLLHRFGRGAGHFFGRFFRAGLAAGAMGLAISTILAVLVRAIGRQLEDSAWEPMPLAVAGVRFGLVALTVIVVLMALDLARVRIVIEDSRQAVRLFFRSLSFVLRHPVKVLGLWAVNSLVLLGVLAAYLAYCNRFPATRGRFILATVIVQQVVMLARAGLRVGLWGSEIALWERMAPPKPARTAAPELPVVFEAEPSVMPEPTALAVTEALSPADPALAEPQPAPATPGREPEGQG